MFRFLGFSFAMLLVFSVVGFFGNWVDVKRADHHVEFHVLTERIGEDCYSFFKYWEDTFSN